MILKMEWVVRALDYRRLAGLEMKRQDLRECDEEPQTSDQAELGTEDDIAGKQCGEREEIIYCNPLRQHSLIHERDHEELDTSRARNDPDLDPR